MIVSGRRFPLEVVHMSFRGCRRGCIAIQRLGCCFRLASLVGAGVILKLRPSHARTTHGPWETLDSPTSCFQRRDLRQPLRCMIVGEV